MNQSSYTQSGIWFDYLRSYVSSRLFWNLEWNVDKLMDEFITLYYDCASGEAKKIYALFDDYYAEKRAAGELQVTILSNTSKYMSGELHDINWLNKIIDTIDNAISGIKADDITTGILPAELASRLEIIKLTPMRMILRNYTSYYSEDTRINYAVEFFDLCDKYNVKNLGESASRSVAARKAEYGL